MSTFCLYRRPMARLLIWFGLPIVAISRALGAGTPVGWGANVFGTTNVPPGLTNVVSLVAGDYFNLALRDDGTVVGWGQNFNGQTSVPPDLAGVKAIAAGGYHALALRSNGTVVAWGDNSAFQTNVPAGLPPVRAVAAGEFHSLVLFANGTVFAWGANNHGQRTIPDGLTGVAAIAAGANHNLALRSNGTVVCWGQNNFGQAPVQVGLNGVIAIAAGGDFSLALRQVGGSTAITGWGNPAQGRTVPPTLNDAVAIAAGNAHGLARRANGTVVCWGDNSSFQTNTPPGLTNVVAIDGGFSHSLALRLDPPRILAQPTNQFVVAGGRADFYVSAGGSTPLTYQWRKDGANLPTATNASLSLFNVQTNHVGFYSVAVSNPLGTIVSSNAALVVNVPAFISQHPESRSVGVGASAFFTATAGGTTPLSYQWRHNGTNIPTGLSPSYLIPSVQHSHAGNYTLVVSNAYGKATSEVAVLTVNNLPGISQHPQSQTVLAGSSASFSVTATDALGYQWQKDNADIPGANAPVYTINQVQTNDAGSYTVVVTNDFGSAVSSPATLTVLPPSSLASVEVVGWGETEVWNGTEYVNVQPPAGLGEVVAVAVGGYHSLALRRDGTVVGWGDNSYGQASPPGGLSGATAIAAGLYHSLARLSNGVVVAWGRTNAGQTAVPAAATNVVAIAAGGFHSLALRGDGRVIGWGSNNWGQATTPPGITNVAALGAGWEHSLGALANGTVAGWGNNQSGQRRTNGLNNIIALAGGAAHSLGLRSNGSVVAWGDNSHNQTNVPPDVANATAIAAGANHSLALLQDGTVRAWGQGNFGQNQPPDGLTAVVAVGAGGDRSLAVARKRLRLDGPDRLPNGRYRLEIGNVDGSPLTPDRQSRIEVYAATNPAANPGAWVKLTNALTLSDGVLRLEDNANLPRRFYSVTERP